MFESRVGDKETGLSMIEVSSKSQPFAAFLRQESRTIVRLRHLISCDLITLSPNAYALIAFHSANTHFAVQLTDPHSTARNSLKATSLEPCEPNNPSPSSTPFSPSFPCCGGISGWLPSDIPCKPSPHSPGTSAGRCRHRGIQGTVRHRRASPIHHRSSRLTRGTLECRHGHLRCWPLVLLLSTCGAVRLRLQPCLPISEPPCLLSPLPVLGLEGFQQLLRFGSRNALLLLAAPRRARDEGFA